MIDLFRDLKDFRAIKRKAFGMPCPACLEKLPRAQPKVLLPQQTCRAHKPHYRDQRPELTQADYDALTKETPHHG
jgi:hypothetical protein